MNGDDAHSSVPPAREYMSTESCPKCQWHHLTRIYDSAYDLLHVLCDTCGWRCWERPADYQPPTTAPPPPPPPPPPTPEEAAQKEVEELLDDIPLITEADLQELDDEEWKGGA